MSPLIFLLVIEGLSRLLGDAKSKGKIKAINLSSIFSITHLLSVDDMVLFEIGSLKEWEAYKLVLNIFCLASRMSITIIPYKMEPIEKGFK